MSDKKIYQYLLSTDGINQVERSLASLDPASVKLDGRTKQDILRFLLILSSQIRYFDLNDQPQGDWRPFLQKLVTGSDIMNDAQLNALFKSEKDCPPHLALLMAFLKAYSYLQADLNRLSSRRLNFYYEDVLKIVRRQAIADQVHVIFELAKNAAAVVLQKGTLLDAGKTSNNIPLLYELDSEYIITQTKIATIMSDFADEDFSGRRIIYKAEDATQVMGVDAGWRPFGLPQLKEGEGMRRMVQASLGCAIASPNFLLAEGKRTVTVVLHLKSNTAVPVQGYVLQGVLSIQMSSVEGWINPDKVLNAILLPDVPGSSELTDSTLTITIEFSEASPAIVTYDEAIHLKRLNTTWPVWSLTLNPTAFFLETLSQFTVTEVDIAVSVSGVSNLVLQNDEALQPTGAPVVPFGHTPSIGSNFFIGSREAFSKSITSIAVNFEWKDVPDDMAAHYAGYENLNINNSFFKSDLYLLAGRTWHKLTTASGERLFNPLGNALVQTVSINAGLITQVSAYTPYERKPDLTIEDAFTLNTQQGFIKVVLSSPTKQNLGNLPAYAPLQAFGHKSFSPIYTQHAIDIALGSSSVLPLPPYTPTLSSVTINYTASDSFKLDSPNLIDQFFVLDVFGAAESNEVSKVTLVPTQEHKGAFYLGVEKAEAAQLLSLFFQMEEGSTPGATLLKPDAVTWDYLSSNRWKTISKSDILEDKTEGFQVAGLVRLLLGPDATNENTLMPKGLHWLRASVDANVEGAADVLNIYTQAARASLQEPIGGYKNDFDLHLTRPLQANTIKSLKHKVPLIKKVSQPTPSFGGRPSETDAAYHQRVHERLRHRNRAVSAWDFERLILEAFPVIFKVKCLPHTNIDNALTPGDVKLVVVPNWRKRPTGNPLQPKINAAFLITVEEFIKANHSYFSNVHVTNPVYETLLVDCKVSFNKGFDPGFYAAKLEDELKRFLSPWSYDEGEDIVFGGKIYASEILAFIEGREYVAYVTDFALYHRHKGQAGGGLGEMQVDIDLIVGLSPEPSVGPPGIGKIIGKDFIVGVPVDTASATQPDAILVSNDTHRIGVLADGDDLCVGTPNIGIGQMVVGLDFIMI